MKLNYKTFGSGEPLIILHGLFGSLDNWQSLAKKYAKYFKVYIIDQRNHGKSQHSETFNYDLLAQDLLAFCKQHQILKTHLIGHSMGGKVVMKFAVQYSQFVNKLIVADIAPVRYKRGHDDIFLGLQSIDLSLLKSREEADKLLQKYIPEFSVRQFLLKGLTRNEERKFVWKYNLDALWKEYENIINDIHLDGLFNGPTLFLKGELSNYILPEYYPKIKKYFPNSTISTIPNVGHWLHAERPKLFLSKTLEFLMN